MVKTQPLHFRRIIAVTAGILVLPLIGMQFSDEVNWTVSDFIVMGVLLFTTGLLLDLAMTRVRKPKLRWLLAGLVLLSALYLYAELAVGIFSNWGS